MLDVLLALITVTVVAQIVALGLQAKHNDLLHLWRQPALLIRSLFAMYVAVPAAAVLMVKLVPLPPGTPMALLVVAISAGAPLVPRRLLEAGGDPPFVLSLAVTSSVLAIATVPLSLEILGAIFSRDVALHPWSVAVVVGKTFLVPLSVGLLVRRVLPAAADRVAPPLTQLASVLFLISAALLIVVTFRLMTRAGLVSFLALCALTLVAMLIGHALGGPRPADRLALGILCATRHVGLAMLIVLSVRNQPAAAALGAYILAALLVSVPYVKWARRGALPGEGARQAGAAP